MNDRKKLIGYKREIKSYLRELDELFLGAPVENELLSLDATEKIRENVRLLQGKPSRKLQIGFHQKQAARFKDYFSRLQRANSHSVYVWTEKSNNCGLFEISSLLKFNLDFQFDVNEQGIIVLVASDLTDKLILDFSHEEGQSTYELEIEVHGDHWPSVDY